MEEKDILLETTSRNRSKPRCYMLISDFANMVKAFIGSNYLSVAYAFSQSGLVMGIICLVVIAAVTDHCCLLLVKCKYHAISNVLNRHRLTSHSDMYKESGPLLTVDSEENETLDNAKRKRKAIYKQMLRSVTYGDIGKIAFGDVGLTIVNACLFLTQFGFCVGYFIFVGNTIHSLFPIKNTALTFNMTEAVSELISSHTIQDENTSSHFATDYLKLRNSSSSEVLASSAFLSASDIPFVPVTNMSRNIGVSEAPDLRLLVIIPVPVVIGFALLTEVRHLGFVSVGANISIFLGCFFSLLYIIIDFKISSTWTMFKWTTLPVFFGMITASYEGIGTIMPIEASMEGNRHNFNNFLHGSIAILTFVLTVFGVVGYLGYGMYTEQMLNKNIVTTSAVGMAINIFLCIGVILTFPLQIYPVIELMEIYTFGYGRICGPKMIKSDSSDELCSKYNVIDKVAVTIPKEVSMWKRNLARMLVIIPAGGIAILMRDLFAYVSAFVGAIGSSLLAYILPCFFHLKLCGNSLSFGVRMKDRIIIIFGIVVSITSLYTTIREVASKVS